MGLIKAAIIVGGGAYAIKKISAHREQKKQGRMAFDQNMASGPHQPQYRDYPEQPQQHQYYDEKHQSRNEKSRGLDAGAEQYTDYPARQRQQQYSPPPQAAVHPYALEFVDRRGSSSPQQQQQQWRLSNSHNAPLPQGHENGYYPPPSYHQNASMAGQRNVTSGFVEPDELSLSDAHSQGPSAWDRKGRRESGSGTPAGAAGLSPKEYLERHLSK
ncbi:hypothetical protein LTR84_007031 [Exophiala bonariae]|uniref:DUF3824 domain-containing protein n=1 Tax=Exophiala bonariae TaxID=1690606 RepID=A0AAV9MZF5_9EURO|nr:hypothetical protein LTR84_007031 [Exophiala bonariae]